MNGPIEVILIIFLLCCPVSAATLDEYDAKIRDNKDNLEDLREQIKKKRKEEKKLSQEKNILSRDIEATERKIMELKEYGEDLNRNAKKLEDDYKSIKEQIGDYIIRAAGYKENLMKGVEYLYRNCYAGYRERHWITCCLPGSDGHSVDIHGRFTEHIVYSVLSNYQQMISDIKAMEKDLELLQIKKRHNEDMVKTVLTNKQQAEEKKKSRQQEMKDIDKKRKRYLEEIEDLNRTSSGLQKLIETFELEKKEIEKEMEGMKKIAPGTFPWPIKGKVVSRFGKMKHPKLNTFVINNGIKIKPEQGEKYVVSVGSGKVVFAEKFKSYGNMLIIAHGNNLYTVYGYLKGYLVTKGSMVSSGDRIAEVMDQNYLYFEVRNNGKPEDPVKWLK